ncbi:hypothetical protein [Streptomyces rishiriensis]|uniref:hypothetical protein n=1 Tax=Streptomyces rishiriensis TaxID=68264 RepID=UPI00131ED705|nr:hypothetical protein [Streptomyces rishiriensis]
MPVRDPRPLEPRARDGAADLATLVAMGVEEPPPIPAPATNPFLAPDWPPAEED